MTLAGKTLFISGGSRGIGLGSRRTEPRDGRHDGMIAILHRPRIHVNILRFLFADFFDPLGDILIGHFGIVVGNLDVFIVLKLDFGEHFEFGFEAEGLAVVDLSHRDVVTVTGPDRLSWLHSLTTQHLLGLQPRQSREALILTPKGHVEHSLHLVDDGETTWITTEPGAGEASRDVRRAEAL